MEQSEVLEHTNGNAFNTLFVVKGVDFTGLTVKAQFKKDVEQASPDFEFKDSDGTIIINIIDTNNATLTFVKTTAQSAAITVGTYKYDIQTKSITNEVQTIGRGTLKVIKNITT